MGSDEQETRGIAPSPEPEDAARPAPVGPIAARRMRRGTRRRKLLLLVLLLLLLLALGYVAWYVNANKRMPFPRAVSAAEDIMEPPIYLYSITGPGTFALNRPGGVVVGRDGRVYVADIDTMSIKVFTTPGTYLFEFSKMPGAPEPRLDAPLHMALDPSGNVWVTDRMLDGAYGFTSEGKFIREFAPDGDAAEKWAPLAIAIDSAGRFYFSDVQASKKHNIRMFEANGTQTGEFGSTSQVYRAQETPGNFYFPNGIAVRGTGDKREVFVADGDNRRVQVFAADGTYKRMIVTEGVPRGITFDRQTPEGEVLLVVDALANQVDAYDPKTGEHMAAFGEPGIGDGQFTYPNDIAVGPDGRIFVADRDNHRVQVWGWPKGEIPGITKLPRGIPAWACCLPFPFLLLPPLFLRRRKFVVTGDFVDAMEALGRIPVMDDRHFRWIMPEHEFPPYSDRVVDGVDLHELLMDEPYSYSDAQELSERLGLDIDRAGVLAMGRRHKRLCTEDAELARLAEALDVEALSTEEWMERYGRKVRRRSGDAGTPGDAS